MRRLLALAALLLVAAGCTTDPEVDSRAATVGLPDLQVDLAADGWVLDAEDSSVEGPATLDFHDDDAVSGVGPCNVYRGTFELDDGGLRITHVATTQQACEDPVMAAEDEYLEALAAVRDVDRSDRDRLVLTGPDDVRLAYRAYDRYEALVGDWEGPPVTFRDDGTVSVGGDCEGDFRLDDGELVVEDLPGDCDDLGLGGTHRIEIGPDALTLVADDGSITLVLRRPT
jgi:heat shock protein HslJ